MAKDNQRGATDIDDASDATHAADEPTAVWDMETLRKAGLSELVDNRHESDPPTGPATPADGVATRPSIIIENDGKPAIEPAPVVGKTAPPTTKHAGQVNSFGWLGLVAIAAVLAIGAFFLIRLFRN